MKIEGTPRELTAAERRLVVRLIKSVADHDQLLVAVQSAQVLAMKDGGMGSLRFLSSGEDEEARRFGRRASELSFDDQDGVKVIASLNLDQAGQLFELDLWKVDFSPLIRLPA